MILTLLVAILFVGGLLAWFFGMDQSRLSALGRAGGARTRTIADAQPAGRRAGKRLAGCVQSSLAAAFRISLHFAADGLSLLLLLLTAFLGIVAVGSAWSEISYRSGFFYFNLLWTLAGVVGVFTALDLFLFFFLLGSDVDSDVFHHRDLGA